MLLRLSCFVHLVRLSAGIHGDSESEYECSVRVTNVECGSGCYQPQVRQLPIKTELVAIANHCTQHTCWQDTISGYSDGLIDDLDNIFSVIPLGPVSYRNLEKRKTKKPNQVTFTRTQ